MPRVYQPRTRLHVLLDSARLSQRMLAEMVGVEASAVSLWMSGKRMPQKSMIAKIAKVLSVGEAYCEGMFIAQNLAGIHDKETCGWIAQHMTDIVKEEKENAQ